MFEKLFRIFDSVTENLSDSDRAQLAVNVAVFGVTGVGKTSSCNVLLGTSWKVGHTEATTSDTWTKTLQMTTDGVLVDTQIQITDFPGLGESIDADEKYLPLYQAKIAAFDAVLWILSANDRQMAHVQRYCNDFSRLCPEFPKKLVLGLNKADLVEPMEWGKGGANLPSYSQEQNIESRVADVFKRMNERTSICNVPKERIVAFSSKHRWRIIKLFEALRKTLPEKKTMSLVRFAEPAQWSKSLEE